MDLELFLFRERPKRYYGHGSKTLEFHGIRITIADSYVCYCMFVSKFHMGKSLVLSYQHASLTYNWNMAITPKQWGLP